MSRIGKLPIIIPDGVSVDIKGKEVIFKGPKGEEKVQGVFVGAVMKASKGQADGKAVTAILNQRRG